jgi:aspartate kinase
MALIVQKYGGTSVGSLARIRRVAEKVMAAKREGHDIVVVVSAMSGDTDRLVDLAYGITAEPNPREYSMLVSTGEQVSMALLAMCLIGQGCPAVSLTGGQAGIVTDSLYHKARILKIDNGPIQDLLAKGNIVIVAGFQGMDAEGQITTLGRGGSDTTAVALAAMLEADECQIYTDVDGVYTADPRVVPEARRLPRITFEEMLEMAGVGAKVLHKRAVEIAGKLKAPLRVLSSFEDGPGTLITFEERSMDKPVEQPIVSGIAFNRNEAKLTIMNVPDRPGIAAAILSPIGKANIDVDMIVQNISVEGGTDFTFTVHREEYDKAHSILSAIAKEIGATEVRGNQKIAKISLVGVGMRTNSGVAQKMFTILGEEGINIQLISTSEIKVSVVIDEKYMELGVRALHAGFGLGVELKEEFDPSLEQVVSKKIANFD